MPAQFEFSQVIDKPLSKVFHFYVDDHVRNHPRWDPDMKLEQISTGPVGIGTIIRRRNSRSGVPVEGTMEVVEFERDHVFSAEIHDGPVEMHGRIVFEAVSDNQTKITTFIDLPSMDETMDRSFLMSRLERSGRNMKQLMESEA